MRRDYEMHGMYGTPTYSVWSSMIYRCNPENSGCKHYYAEKGISVCDRWKNSFEAFYADMGEKPKGKSIDRIDNSKGYYPGNCRWATPRDQAINTDVRKDSESGIKGVRYIPRRGKWEARGCAHGMVSCIYWGDSKDDAIKARRQWELENGYK